MRVIQLPKSIEFGHKNPSPQKIAFIPDANRKRKHPPLWHKGHMDKYPTYSFHMSNCSWSVSVYYHIGLLKFYPIDAKLFSYLLKKLRPCDRKGFHFVKFQDGLGARLNKSLYYKGKGGLIYYWPSIIYLPVWQHEQPDQD